MTMHTRIALLLVVAGGILVSCSGAPGSAATNVGTAASSPPSEETAPAASDAAGGSDAPSAAAASEPAESPAPSTAAGLPAGCAEGFAAYLTAIEPIVSGFDPASATLADLSTAEEGVREKAIELLQANDSTATYDCTAIGLEWAYFDSSSPWDAVLAFAGEAAPGTVAYLTALQGLKGVDAGVVGDYGIDGCDAAVASIKERVADASADGVEAMTLEDGLALLGLYRAYMRDVQNEVCPRDALGNDEFDFFGRMG